jgi:flagellar basal body-associated protein FliL
MSHFFSESEKIKMLKIIVIALFVMVVLFLWSACIISGRCSREEEKR